MSFFQITVYSDISNLEVSEDNRERKQIDLHILFQLLTMNIDSHYFVYAAPLALGMGRVSATMSFQGEP